MNYFLQVLHTLLEIIKKIKNITFLCCCSLGFPGGAIGKESTCNTGDPGFDPWVGKIPWRRKWQPAPVFCLENPTDRGAWRAAVHGVAKSRTRLK